MWHNVSHTSKTINSPKGIRIGEKIILSASLTVEKQRRRERKKYRASLSDLRISIDRNSLSQELKFIYSTRAMRKYQNRGISLKIQKRSFGGNKKGRVKRPSQDSNGSSTFYEVDIFPTLVYFHTKGSFLREILGIGPKGLFG